MIQSLRGRLTAGLAAVVALGLLASGIATYTALQSFLYERVDNQLVNGRFAALGLFTGPDDGGGRPSDGHGGPPSYQFPAGTIVQLRDPKGGRVLQQRILPGDATSPPSSDLPGVAVGGAVDTPVLGWAGRSGGGSGYRVATTRLDQFGGDVLVIAVPLTDVDATLQRLLLIEVLVSVGVLAATLAMTWLTVRLGLRPLQRMGVTAEAIAAGDISRRVEPATPRTEIGRLGIALNEMLHQIEAAFAERARSEQRLRRFVADASHELRTPLTSIRGYAELLRGRAAASPEDSALARRRIEQEAVRMTGLVDDMLLLARLDQGRPLERDRVDLAPLARDAVDDARVVAPKRRITLEGEPELVVTGDEMRIRQVIGNLVRNALVHTPDGTPLEVRLWRAGTRAVIGLVDHGPGLPEALVERIFEPFFRADAGRSRDRGGTGLGLSIVAAVVAAHGGRVEVRPTAGGGATFEVEFPADSQPAAIRV